MPDLAELGQGSTAQGLVDLQPQLARIRHRFLDRLSERCLEIETCAQQLDRTGLAAVPVTLIAQQAHKIAGVASTLGFDRLGELSAKTDAQLPHLANDEDWTTARSLIEALLEEIESVLETHAPM